MDDVHNLISLIDSVKRGLCRRVNGRLDVAPGAYTAFVDYREPKLVPGVGKEG